MISFRYAQYLVLKFFPLAISALSAAYLIFYGLIATDTNLEDLRNLCLSGLVLSTIGWASVFITEESLRKLILASHVLIESVSKALEESENEDRNQV